MLGRLPEAESCYRQALETAPDEVEIRVNLGNLLSRLGRYEEADEAYRLVLRTAPEDAGASPPRPAPTSAGSVRIGLGRLRTAAARRPARSRASASAPRTGTACPYRPAQRCSSIANRGLETASSLSATCRK
ncbi:MAG: tetratricopeptide repeat protein [Comamonadaceae bacterium]|nr:tetratricopeptide repeat protein [Comamonadaceae bacterium]